MRPKTLLLLAPVVLALTACHSRGGYMSADPELTYGPGVVEFPDPQRVYLPEYRRGVVATAVPVHVVQRETVRVAPPRPVDRPVTRIQVQRPDPTASARVTAPAPSVRVSAPAVRVETSSPRVVATGSVRPANVTTVRSGRSSGTELVLDRPVSPTIDDVRIRTQPVPTQVVRVTSGVATAPPKGAPLPPPTSDRPYKETNVVVTPGGVYTR